MPRNRTIDPNGQYCQKERLDRPPREEAVMNIVYLLLAMIIVLLWLERRARQKTEKRAEKMERSRELACLQVYNGWIYRNWLDFVKNYSEEQGLDYMALVSGIELRDLTEDEVKITPWDTPETIRQQGKEGLLPWQVHPDQQEIKQKFEKNVAKERERIGVK
jgi:hypothetical protein